jgi:septal ring factor EnvC (AmiA/AmiB activator)
MKTWKQYKRKGLSEMREYKECDDMNGVSVSEEDANNGSPKVGDMIARNPKNHKDQWLVAEKYFTDNLELADAVCDSEEAEEQVADQQKAIEEWKSDYKDRLKEIQKLKAQVAELKSKNKELRKTLKQIEGIVTNPLQRRSYLEEIYNVIAKAKKV